MPPVSGPESRHGCDVVGRTAGAARFGNRHRTFSPQDVLDILRATLRGDFVQANRTPKADLSRSIVPISFTRVAFQPVVSICSRVRMSGTAAAGLTLPGR